MMKLKYINIIGVAVLTFIASSVFAVTNSNLHLQLDKNCYVSGETIRFKNTISNDEKGEINNLFVDLCGEGYLLSSAIVKRSNSHWVGELAIPDSVQTGIYLVRAYIGNELGEPTLVYRFIPVLNRFGNNSYNEQKKQNATNQPYFPSSEHFLPQGEVLKIYADKSTFKPNETAQFNIKNEGDDFIGGISFEVVKTDTSINSDIPINNGFEAYSFSEKNKIYNGLSLCGRVLNKTTTKPVPDEIVLFSISDTIPQINYSPTNEKGEFQINIDNYYGIQTAIVQVLNKTSNLNIELYPLFLLPPTNIPYYLPIETEESEFAKLAVKRASFTKAYQVNKVSLIEPATQFSYPFYGSPKQVVFPSMFVDLIDFEEIAKEILPLVSYKNLNGERSIRIYDPVNKCFYNNPWVLIDGVPISDLAMLNKLNSTLVKRIDTQPIIRCYGDLFIEGVVSVFTKAGGFKEMNLPRNSIITTFDTYLKPTINNISGELFFRDILYWNPFIEEFSKQTKIDVKCSLEKGTYTAITEGIRSNGQVQRSVFNFTVSGQ